MKTPITAASAYPKSTEETEITIMLTKLIWIPGIKPVTMPAKTPKTIAISINPIMALQ